MASTPPISATAVEVAATATNPLLSYITNFLVTASPEILNSSIAISPDGSKAYISIHVDNTVTVVDTATNTIEKVIKVSTTATGAQGIAVSPNGSKVYVANIVDDTVSVIDTKSATVTKVIAVGDAPVDVVASSDGKHVYVLNSNDRTISVIATATGKVEHVITEGLVTTGFLAGLAVSPDSSHVYTIRDGALTSIDTKTYSMATTALPGHTSYAWNYGVAVSPDNSTVYIAVMGGYPHSSVIAITNGVVRFDTSVSTNPLSITVNPDSSHVYVGQGALSIADIDAGTGTVISSMIDNMGQTGLFPLAMAVNPKGTRLYVMNTDGYFAVLSTGAAPSSGGGPASGDLVAAAAHISMQVKAFLFDLAKATRAKAEQVIKALASIARSINSAIYDAIEEVHNFVASNTVQLLNVSKAYADGGILNAYNYVRTLALLNPTATSTNSPQTTGSLFSTLWSHTSGDRDGVVVDKISATDGTRYIVYIAGTDWFGHTDQTAAKNLPSYLGIVYNHQVNVIRAAIGDDTSAKIMLVGYSQGGMDAVNIAANKERLGLNVTTVVTFGSPVNHAPPGANEPYRIINIQDDLDWIPNTLNNGSYASDNIKSYTLYRNSSSSDLDGRNLLNPFYVHSQEKTYVELGNMFDDESYPALEYIKQFRTGKVNTVYGFAII